ncbi:MAG: lipase family protein [Candidatus Peribacteria bacterium]|jgi:hypothetical protein|nr:lipase family protein [Candidatus Peribacteria bacterium]
MPKPLIPSTVETPVKLSFGQKTLQKAMEIYAKTLGNKKFIPTPLQQHDDQIVRIVQEVYNLPANRQKVIGDRKLDEEFNEVFHAVYVHLDSKKILICYRGTDFSDLKDIFSDVQIVLGINVIDVRVRESRDFYDNVSIKYGTYEKWVTGHSLGGTISYLVTKHRNPDRCIVFNPGA